MKKRGTLSLSCIILLLLLLPSAFSIYEELVYSETVNDGDTAEIAGKLFEFKIDSASKKVFVKIDVSAIIVSSGQCKIKDNLDICVGNINYSYRNYTIFQDVYKAEIDIYQIKSSLDSTHTIEKNNLLIGEDATAELTFENIADIVAEDVTATIEIPTEILVTETEGCKTVLNKIIFEEDIYPRQIRACIYKIKGQNGGSFELAANLTYFNGVETIKTTSDIISGKVYNYSLEAVYKSNKSRFNIQEKLNLTLYIENTNDEYDLQITNFNIKIPEQLLILKIPKDTVENNKIITWKGTLAPNENKSFEMELQGLKTGNYSVLTEASYKIDKFSRTLKEPFNIEVYCNCPFINHEFSQQISYPNQKIGLSAFIINPSPIHTFSNVEFNYKTNIPDIQDFSTVYSSIKPRESIKIFESQIIGPDLDETYHLNITAIYKSSSSQVFVLKDNIILKVPYSDEERNASNEDTILDEEKIEEGTATEQEPDLVIGEEEITQGLEKNETIEGTIPAIIIEEKSEKPFILFAIINDIASMLGIGKEKINQSSEEADKKEFTTIKKADFVKAFTIMGYIAAVVFIFVILITFKRKRREKKERELKSKKTLSSQTEESEFNNIEDEIKKLGESLEREKQRKKKRLF